MINENTFETTHVSNYSDLSVKEQFRIYTMMEKQHLHY